MKDEKGSWLGLIRFDTLFAALLALGSYPLTVFWLFVWLLPTSTVAMIFSATMLQNAHDDSEQDLQRGGARRFASNNAKSLARWCSIAWTNTTVLLTINLLYSSWWEFGILLVMAIGGRLYTHTRHYPGASMLVVATVFTTPLLLGVPDLTPRVVADTATFFVFILVLELGSDLRDWKYDQEGPWKNTLPVALGMARANWVYVVLATLPLIIQFVVGIIEFRSFETSTSPFPGKLILWGALFTILSGLTHVKKHQSEYSLNRTRTLSKGLQLAAFILFSAGFLLD